MDFLSDSVLLSRMQFALTAIFHMLWPVLTTGMSIYRLFNSDYVGVQHLSVCGVSWQS